jgi:lipoprotein-releasing system permease protein|tara:strand:- start:21639 stop:22856 length:1218 start_codon:yes stop_codon:yes gene_type:complete
LNLPFFISNKITKKSEGTFSQTIHKVAITSIAIGMISLLLSFMILGGFKKTISEKIYSFGGQLLITQFTQSSSFENASFLLSDTLIRVLEAEPYITRFQSFALKAGLLKTKEEVQGIIFKGIDIDFDTSSFQSNLVKGRFPSLSDDAYSLEVMLSSRIADYLKLDTGDEVLVYFVQNPPRFRNLQVSGIYQTGLEDFDDKIILGDLSLIRRLNDWEDERVGGVEVFIDNNIAIGKAHSMLYKNMAADLYVENIEEKYVQLFDWLALLNRNVYIFLALILLVASFSMVSILLILIMERTQMIGLLKSFGATNQMIRRIFITSGTQLLIKGLVWGNIIAIGLGFLQYHYRWIPLDPDNYYMSYVPIDFNLAIILGVNLLTFVLVALSLFIPISMINRIQAIDAIRFD